MRMWPHDVGCARARFITRAAAILLAVVAMAQWNGAWAQTNNRPGYRSDTRNPFELTAPIIERVTDGEAKVGFQPADSAFEVPKMKLRGLVLRRDGGKAALLEVQGVGTHVVREGDTIGLNPAVAQAVIRVKRIDRMQVEVEAGSMRQIIIVR